MLLMTHFLNTNTLPPQRKLTFFFGQAPKRGKLKRDKTLGASSEENKESRNPYHDKGFRLSYDIEILFDMFSSEDSRRNSS